MITKLSLKPVGAIYALLAITFMLISQPVFSAVYYYQKDDGTAQGNSASLSGALAALGNDPGIVTVLTDTNVSSTIVLKAGQILQGGAPGVSIVMTNTTSDIVRFDGFGCGVRDITLTRSSSINPTGSAININGQSVIVIKGVFMIFNKNGIYSSSTGTITSLSIERSLVYWADEHFIDLSNVTVAGLNVEDSDFQWSGSDGFDINFSHSSRVDNGMSPIAIVNCALRFCDGNGISIKGNNIIIQRLIVNTTEGHGILLDGSGTGTNLSRRIYISNSTIVDAGSTVDTSNSNLVNWTTNNTPGTTYRKPDKHGIRVTHLCNDIEIRNNLIGNSAEDGVNLYNSSISPLISGPNNVRIQNNTIHSNDRYYEEASRAAIFLEALSASAVIYDLMIQGNRAYNDPDVSSIGTWYQDYGLSNYRLKPDRMIMTGNNFNDPAQTGYYLSPAATNSIIDNNL